MDEKRKRTKGHPGSLELIEEAVHLLRKSPPGVFAPYYLGTIPFVLGFLFFWADMSRGYNAAARLVPAALSLAVAYVFMKTMQTVFARRLSSVITGETHQFPFRQIARSAVMHSMYQPWGFVLLPAALLLTVPFGWCFAFFQNLTVLGPAGEDLTSSRKKAWELALAWPAQNHLALGILLLFSSIVMANLLVAAIYAPQLVRIFLGVETVLTRSGPHLANTTFLMVIAACTYLCVDPIVKAFYTLRCYYARSLNSGEDLIAELKSARRQRAAGVLTGILILVACLSGAVAAPAGAAESVAGSPAAAGYPPEEIEEAVNTVLERLEYSWRLPRKTAEEQPEPEGFFHDMLSAVGRWLEKAAETVDRFFQWLGDILKKLFPDKGGGKEKEASGPALGSAMLYVLLFAGAAVCALILQRFMRSRPASEEAVAPEPAAAATNLEDERILASDLPENEWMAMARELLERGEVRLGIRAMYLASLASLAGRGIIILARHKTDREYERELTLRGAALSSTASAFKDLTVVFEKAWYGMHTISTDTLDFFIARHREIMTDGA